jgi:hypothetical protein
MNSGDFDTKLDEALSQLATGDDSKLPARGVPETKDLVLVARRLHVLAPAPMPNLANGRLKFLAQAVRVGAQPGSTRRWPLQPNPRLVLAFAGSAVMVLIVGVIITLIASSLVAGIAGAPGWWFSSTPTLRPTYTATPTQISLAPVDSRQIRSGWVSEIDSRPFLPPPNPAPQAEASRQTLR